MKCSSASLMVPLRPSSSRSLLVAGSYNPSSSQISVLLKAHSRSSACQSALYQVANNTESGRRQYDLRGRDVALGWPADKVIVIDIDQGQSGASAADREGFQRLVAEVSLGRAGICLLYTS